MENSGIYKIENLVNGKVYIGSAVNLERRWWEHKTRLEAKTHPNKKLTNAWHKHGSDKFEFKVIIYCEPKDLIMYEQRCIDGFKAVGEGYNLCPTAGSALGIKRSEETKKRMSESQKGKPKSAEAATNSAKARLGSKRGAHSEQSKKKIGDALRGRTLGPQSEETKRKRSEALKGRPRSEETKRKISESRKNKTT